MSTNETLDILSSFSPDTESDDFPILELILRNYLQEEDIQLIRRAYLFALTAHQGQVRDSGEPYITHPIAVAEILAELQLDAETLSAAILHDVIEDTDITYEHVEQEFGRKVADMVLGVTKVGKIQSGYRSEEEIENLRRMLMATAKDLHVMVIKMADRLHNMRTLHHLNRAKQTRIAQQTLNIYAPLAHRLGLGKIRWEMEDLCLMFLHPDSYRQIKKNVSLKRREREEYLQSALTELESTLLKKGFKVFVEGRAKHFYSIFMKMIKSQRTFSEIYDLTALRVITENVGDCYAVLGEVHTMWRQIPGRFKDYISNPKANNYRSIHTTVLGPQGRMIEIQIRTQEMHTIAEYGIAAHWRYKLQGSSPRMGRDSKWLEAFSLELPDTQDPEDFIKAMRSELFSDEVYVYTPKGKLVNLPKDATPLDFAYKIHTELGHRCGGAKINNRLVSLIHPLKTGDVVEIVSNPNSHPTPAWLNIVKTASARNKIRRHLLESQHDELLEIGQTNLSRELKKAGFNPLEFYNSPKSKEVAENLRLKNLDELFVNIGFGRVNTKQVIARLLLQKDRATPPPRDSKESDSSKSSGTTAGTIVKLGDIDDIMYRIARCCSPLPGDDIVGYVTRGRGVTIHKATCSNMKIFAKDRHRVMPLFWEGDQRSHLSVTIQIVARDRQNLLGEVSQLISSTGTNINGCKTNTATNIATLDFTVEVSSTTHLNTVMQQLLGVEGVKSVRRLRTRGRNKERPYESHKKNRKASRMNQETAKHGKGKPKTQRGKN
ncbi:MAG: bifunctional (p)ppGpp synthetase/guanosine-3',5'-bis(diphosphate) 3'-pyrophosphohydrolase [bacterium]|jgi:GTP pyrophosphokinase|nr:bifunctional (p)ppGpp synthetase/guanosine-3',5'-bis(diphosphate) 3'-pyrophosphohydrolase [bacterium]